MSVDVDDKEFVALNTETIRTLLEAGQRATAERRTRERRDEKRWPFPGTVQLWVLDRNGDEIETYATCQNLNEAGLGLLSERPFPVGLMLPLAIHQPDATYHGKGIIRHCTPSNGGYFVGVELTDRIDD